MRFLTENIEKYRMTTHLWELSVHYTITQFLAAGCIYCAIYVKTPPNQFYGIFIICLVVVACQNLLLTLKNQQFLSDYLSFRARNSVNETEFLWNMIKYKFYSSWNTHKKFGPNWAIPAVLFSSFCLRIWVNLYIKVIFQTLITHCTGSWCSIWKKIMNS